MKTMKYISITAILPILLAVGCSSPATPKSPTPSNLSIQQRLDTNPIRKLADRWNENASRVGYEPSSPLEQQYQDYLMAMGDTCASIATKGVTKPSEIMAIAKGKLEARRANLIKAFTLAGYSSGDVEFYIAYLDAIIERHQLPQMIREMKGA